MSPERLAHHGTAASLRAELKEWEKAFRAQHGRKAGRDDIKQDAVISAKYKLYNDVTRPPRQQPAPPPPPPPLASTPRKSTRNAPAQHSPVKRSSNSDVSATPRKTPIRSRSAAAALQPRKILSPVQEAEPQPTPQWIRAALGPTPQRDGHVLGLFDLDDDVQETPLKAGAGGGRPENAASTPSKGTSSAEHVHLKSPESSSGKRFMLAAFAGTPLKRKRDGNDLGTTSSSKHKFATPSFLRRCDPLARISEDDSTQEPVHRPPFQKRGLVRSLSTIIQNLKKQQDKAADEEWDIMNEIEAEERGETVQTQKEDTPEVQVENSHAVEMPLGPDQAPESSDEDDGPGHQQPGRKAWKKKGLKRQTRRTNMRPVFHKAGKEGDEHPEPSDGEERDAGGNGDEFDDADDNSQDEGTSKQRKKALQHSQAKEQEKALEAESKKKPRKVNAEAHANYRMLNIKNKNSKAKGRGGRFGRR